MVLYQKLYKTVILSGCHDTCSPFPLSNAAFETADTLSVVSEDGIIAKLDHKTIQLGTMIIVAFVFL